MSEAFMVERLYQIHSVAISTGLSENLIRAWERRYGVPKPARSDSGYRVYTEEDIALLKKLKQLTEENVSISHAVKLVVPDREDKAPKSRRRRAGTVADLERVRAWVSAVLHATEAFDQLKIDSVLETALGSVSAQVFFESLAVPVLREVGKRWRLGQFSTAQDHLVTQVVRQKISSLLQRGQKNSKWHVVCACPPNETHELGLLGAALRYQELGWRVTYLGANTPVDELVEVVERTNPQHVAISMVRPDGGAAYLKSLSSRLSPETQITLAGQGAVKHRKLAVELGILVHEDSAHIPEHADA
jgi:MerR family transcriptional regulator, light-induced transcriptional regulator